MRSHLVGLSRLLVRLVFYESSVEETSQPQNSLETWPLYSHGIVCITLQKASHNDGGEEGVPDICSDLKKYKLVHFESLQVNCT